MKDPRDIILAPVVSESVTKDPRGCCATKTRSSSSRRSISCASACEKSNSRICLPLCSMNRMGSSMVDPE